MAREPSARSRVDYKDIREYAALLEREGLLRRVQAEVDLDGEIGAICARSLDQGGPGLLFENIKDYPDGKLITNIISTTPQAAIAFNTDQNDDRILDVIHYGKDHPIAPTVIDAAPCQEVVHTGDDVDLYMFPTPVWHEKDGGPYIGTTAGVTTANPENGYINSGLYRCMILDKTTMTAEMRGDHEIGEDPMKRGSQGGHVDVLKNERVGKNSPIALAIGMDPLLTYVAGQGVPSDELEHAEYAVAGGWRGEPVELVKCKTNDLLVPAHSEIIIEGEVLAYERSPDGPWGENADIYNGYQKVFVVKATCITHRRDPMNYGLICRPLQDYPKFLMAAGLRNNLGAALDIVSDAHVFPRTGNRPFAVVAARVDKPEDIETIIQAVESMPRESYLSALPRWLVIVDEGADVRDRDDLLWRFTLGVRPDKDIIVRPVRGRSFGPAIPMLVIDATFKNKPELEWGPGVDVGADPPVAKTTPEMARRLDARWQELGLD